MHLFAVTIFWFWIIGGQFCIFAVPFYYVLRKNTSFTKGVLMTWGLMIFYYFISSVPFCDFVYHFAPEYKTEVADGNTIIAALMTGWLPGLIISSLALAMRNIIQKFKKSQQKQ